MFDQKFCMRNPHFLLDKLDEPIFHKKFDIFFSTYPHTHVSNTLFVDDTPYKSMFNGLYSAIFWSCLMAIMGKINICWGLFSLTWKILIHLDMVFPHLLNTIPLVGLDVLIEIIQEFLKCYL